MRRGNSGPSNEPASMAAAARHSAVGKLARLASAPHKAEPSANEPRADNTCKAEARERTQGGALPCVAVL
jgi:hypothetical protein